MAIGWADAIGFVYRCSGVTITANGLSGGGRMGITNTITQTPIIGRQNRDLAKNG